MKCVLHPLSFVRLAWLSISIQSTLRRRVWVVATFKFYSLSSGQYTTPGLAIFVCSMYVTTLLDAYISMCVYVTNSSLNLLFTCKLHTYEASTFVLVLESPSSPPSVVNRVGLVPIFLDIILPNS